MDALIITKHAFDRARERTGLGRSATRRLSHLAYLYGLHRIEATGSLKTYLDREFARTKAADNMRVYANKVFVFSGPKLLTVYELPKELRIVFLKQMARRATA